MFATSLVSLHSFNSTFWWWEWLTFHYLRHHPSLLSREIPDTMFLCFIWLHSFETYLIAAGLTEVSAARKKALLQLCLCVEGQRVLGTISDTTEASHDRCVTLLNEYFTAPQSVLLWRFIFRRCHQLPGESRWFERASELLQIQGAARWDDPRSADWTQ